MQRTDIQSLLDGLRDIDIYLATHQKSLRARLLAAYDFRPTFRYQSLRLPAIILQLSSPAIPPYTATSDQAKKVQRRSTKVPGSSLGSGRIIRKTAPNARGHNRVTQENS